MSVRIVTDSTADIPKEVVQRLGITVVPCDVRFGTEVYRDGVDLDTNAFYQRLVTSNPLPTTSQPSVGTFLEHYQRLTTEGEPVVSIHVSAKLSGTCNSALQAKERAQSTTPIEVVDSQTVSIALGLIVLSAAEAAAAGATLEEVLAIAKQDIARARLYVVLDTLEYMQKGGRIGKAQAFLGSILNIKPILEVRDGEVLPLERARTLRKAMERICALGESHVPLSRLAVIHTTNPEEADLLAQRLIPCLPDGEILISQVGPVVGTYAGPGCVGVGMLLQEAASVPAK